MGIGPSASRRDPALSGDGRLLASITEQGGRTRLIIQDQPGGRWRPLRHLERLSPQSSPSLSWNGRYVAALVHRGGRRLVMVEDRLSGKLLRLPLARQLQPERVSLAPDGSRLAVQVLQGNQWRVQLFDLASVLERDPPAGSVIRGGGLLSR